MLQRCRAHQRNVPANDATVETGVAEGEHVAPEPFLRDSTPLPTLGELQAEAARLGLAD